MAHKNTIDLVTEEVAGGQQLVFCEEHIIVFWNGSATFNVWSDDPQYYEWPQTGPGWENIHCFTNYYVNDYGQAQEIARASIGPFFAEVTGG